MPSNEVEAEQVPDAYDTSHAVLVLPRTITSRDCGSSRNVARSIPFQDHKSLAVGFDAKKTCLSVV